MKRTHLIIVLTLSSLNLFAQTSWVRHASNPILLAEPETWEYPKIIPGSVIFLEGNYHMWYTAGDRSSEGGIFLIGHAISADGISWTKNENNPVYNLIAEYPLFSLGVGECESGKYLTGKRDLPESDPERFPPQGYG